MWHHRRFFPFPGWQFCRENNRGGGPHTALDPNVSHAGGQVRRSHNRGGTGDVVPGLYFLCLRVKVRRENNPGDFAKTALREASCGSLVFFHSAWSISFKKNPWRRRNGCDSSEVFRRRPFRCACSANSAGWQRNPRPSFFAYVSFPRPGGRARRSRS